MNETGMMTSGHSGIINENKTVKTIEAGRKYTKGRTSTALRYNAISAIPIGSHYPG